MNISRTQIEVGSFKKAAVELRIAGAFADLVATACVDLTGEKTKVYAFTTSTIFCTMADKLPSQLPVEIPPPVKLAVGSKFLKGVDGAENVMQCGILHPDPADGKDVEYVIDGHRAAPCEYHLDLMDEDAFDSPAAVGDTFDFQYWSTEFYTPHKINLGVAIRNGKLSFGGKHARGFEVLNSTPRKVSPLKDGRGLIMRFALYANEYERHLGRRAVTVSFAKDGGAVKFTVGNSWLVVIDKNARDHLVANAGMMLTSVFLDRPMPANGGVMTIRA